MSWIENSLTHLETYLRSIIEGGLDVDGVPRKLYIQVQQALVSAMQGGSINLQRQDHPGTFINTAPDQYTLLLPADQAIFLLSHPVALDRLAHKLARTAAQQNIELIAPPMLRVVGSPTVEHLNIHTEFSHAGMNDSYTAVLEDKHSIPNGIEIKDIPKAFLIVNGLATFPIVQAVTNIGSGSDNHLVLEGPEISLKHAQLRLINNHFIIFDLDSRRGTFVNGVPVASQTLNPGDVILLAGVPLVYGHELHTRVGYTQELPPTQQRPDVL